MSPLCRSLFNCEYLRVTIICRYIFGSKHTLCVLILICDLYADRVKGGQILMFSNMNS